MHPLFFISFIHFCILVSITTEGSSKAEVSWEIDWSHTQLKVQSALVVFQHITYEDGHIDWQVCTGDVCVNGAKSKDEAGLV